MKYFGQKIVWKISSGNFEVLPFPRGRYFFNPRGNLNILTFSRARQKRSFIFCNFMLFLPNVMTFFQKINVVIKKLTFCFSYGKVESSRSLRGFKNNLQKSQKFKVTMWNFSFYFDFSLISYIMLKNMKIFKCQESLPNKTH